jgi:DNA polymerase elongation subunit (family B)
MADETGSIVFQCLDFVARDEYVASQKEFKILLFGVNHEGKSTCIQIDGFRPFFYVQIPDSWSLTTLDSYKTWLKAKTHLPTKSLNEIKLTEERHKKLFNFDNGSLHRFLKIEVPSIQLWRQLRDHVLSDKSEPLPISVNERETICECANFCKCTEFVLKVYEANIDPVLRFFHMRDLEPAGWMKIPKFKFDEMESAEKEPDPTASLRYTCDWRFIERDKSRLALAPLLIASWDIECMSSHGDFPQPKKTWRKPARELLEAGIKDAQEALDAIIDAMNEGVTKIPNGSRLSPIYSKDGKKKKRTAIGDIITDPSTFEECLTDTSGTQDDQITRIDQYLRRMGLPEIAGDEIIQIGIVLYRNNKPESKHIFVLNTCDRDKVAPPSMNDVPIHVYPFEKERDVLVAFHKWLAKTDPDVMIGYNIFGFDEKYIWDRCEELGLVDKEGQRAIKNSCLKSWSRLRSSWARLNEKFLSSSAMGDNTMYIINAPGRLKVDLLPYIRRNYNLDSYTLDNVAATFMSGTITGDVTQVEADVFCVPTKSTKGAVPGRFIVLMDDENDHVLDKAEIVRVEPKAVYIKALNGATKLQEHGLKPSRWAQVKDDVSPKELFALQRKTAADRAKIARYCLQDCDLVMELFMKLEILNNAVAMANICSVPVSFIFMRGQGIKIESLVFKECRELDQLIEVLPAPKFGFGKPEPVQELEVEDGELPPIVDDPTYEGAFVLDPVTGIYFDNDPVGVPDFSSLYPSTIISENLCHSSVVWVKDYKPDGSVILQEGSDEYDNLPEFTAATERDPLIEEFYSSLSPSERLAHEIAARPVADGGLGTSYSVTNTHSFIKWLKNQATSAKPLRQNGYVTIEYDILINDPADKRKHPEKIKDGVRKVRFAQLPNGEKSTIPKILQKLLKARKDTRKMMATETDEFRKALLDAAQNAYKLTANSLYGQLGSGTSKIRRMVLAASTTAYGRTQLINAKTTIEAVYGGNRDPRCDAMAVYGDTDSLFIRWRPKDSATGERISGEEAVALAKDLTEEAGGLVSSCLRAPHDFEFDKVFKTFCLLSKKRYVGDMSEGDLDDFHRKAMGIVMKRRDNAQIVKLVYGGVIEKILTDQDIKGAFAFAQKACRDLVAGKYPISKLTITKSLSAEYKTPNPPAHKILAERIGQRDPGNKPSTSERIPYVYIPAPEGSTLQGDRIETPTYIKDHGLKPDYAFYITNQIAKPVAQVFGLVVEQLPGVKREDLERIKLSKKPTEARESLAQELLFGALLNEIAKKKKTETAAKKASAEQEAREKFVKQHMK